MNSCSKESFIKEFVKQLKCEKASLFIGSGISRKAGYANWQDILRECAEEIGLEVDKENDLITLAEYYVRDKLRTKINQTIAEYFDDSKGNPVEVHRIISTLPISSIWTTNYDTLLERCLNNADISNSVITDDKSYSNLNRSAKVKIHKIHGDVKNASECVITRKDYEKFEEQHDIVLSELKGEMCTNSFLFLGYGFNDTDIQHILSKIRLAYEENHPQRHFCILEKVKRSNYKEEDDFEYDQKRQSHHVADMQSYGINVVLVNSYDEIESILKEISLRVHLTDVLICGAYEDNSRLAQNRIAPLTEKLAEQLIISGYKIFTGYGKNLGSDIVSGAFKGCGNVDVAAKKFNDNVFLFPFPFKLSENADRSKLYTGLRKNMIAKTHISIFICGEKANGSSLINSPGTMEEYELSKLQGNLIIPIATTGGAARAIWDDLNKNDIKYSQNELFQKLDKEINPENIVNTVFEIIEEYSHKYK